MTYIDFVIFPCLWFIYCGSYIIRLVLEKIVLEFLSILLLELLACLLLNKLLSEMCSAVSSRLLIDSRSCWTDSEVALCWIMGKEKGWKSWVKNRVLRVERLQIGVNRFMLLEGKIQHTYRREFAKGMILIGDSQVLTFYLEAKWDVRIQCELEIEYCWKGCDAKPRKGIEVFFENSDDFKTRV